LLTARTLRDSQAQSQMTRNELAGAHAVSALLDVAIQTQTHRGQTNLALSGDASAGSGRGHHPTRLQAALQAASTQLNEHPGGLGVAEPASRPSASWRRVSASGAGRAAVFQTHTRADPGLQG
jgi:hypothetical protein